MTAQLTDEQFLESFTALTFPPEAFHHREHLRAAFLFIRGHGMLQGTRRFSEALRRFAIHAGSPGLYHETITLAYLMLIGERMRGEQPEWERFAAENADLFAWKPSLLDRYYTPETLWSAEARSRFVMPDAAPPPAT